jgi:hypothetical protein
VHLVPGSAWYALGLFVRDGVGDRDRCFAVLEALLELQYDRPGEVWHGTFARFAESPEPGPHAVEWDDYDPNWRQFVGTTWLLILRHFEARLPSGLTARLDRSLRLAVEGEPPDRIGAWYTNIALMKSLLEVEAGDRLGEPGWVAAGHDLAAGVIERRETTGAFDEYNSPTYYGVDLYGLALWRTCPVSDRLAAWGARIESALWADTATFWHAGLGNVCGPYTRSYGMDLNRYVAAVALWLWPVIGSERTPLPNLDADVVEHSHDVCLGAAVALLGSAVPPDLVDRFVEFQGPVVVERMISDRPERRVSAWMVDGVMLGGESNAEGWPAWHQFHPATAHWQAPGNIGSVRLVHNGSVQALARDGVLVIECGPADDGESLPTFMIEVDDLDPSGLSADRWDLPGIVFDVATDATLDAVIPFGDHHLVVFRPRRGACRFELSPRV